MDNETLKYYKPTSEEMVVIVSSVLVGVGLLLANYLYIRHIAETLITTIINILAALVITVPTALIEYAKSQDVKELEERFPDYMRSIVEGLHGGMTLPIALKYASRSSYGTLDLLINRMIAKISWGVPFEEAMRDFARETGSRVVMRATATIIEAHKSGGDIAAVMESVSQSTISIEKLRRERSSKISTQMMQGYVIYIIFIGIMIGLQKFLIPALGFGSGNPASIEKLTKGDLFLHLAVLQGMFAGLAIGKLSEGRLSAGFKHALILGIVGFASLTLSAV